MNAEKLFAPLAIVVSILAYVAPPAFLWMKPHIPLLLGLIMLGMGTTLTLADFAHVMKSPKYVAVGVAAQFGFMPLLGLLISMLLGLSPQATAGIVLLGACPGGTASNVMAYLAKANVGLSVSLTLVSTLLAPLLTPWLTWLYAHQAVDVQILALMKSIVIIVILPIGGGILLRTLFKSGIKKIHAGLPLFSMLIILAVIGCVMSINADRLSQLSLVLMAAVMLHNGGGLLFGFWSGKRVSNDPQIHRTIAIEVGMQNSGLAAALALSTAAFGPEAALPAALFSLWHNITGSLLAGYWSARG